MIVWGDMKNNKTLLKIAFIISFFVIVLAFIIIRFYSFNKDTIQHITDKTSLFKETLIIKKEDIFDLKPTAGVVDSVDKTLARARITGTIINLSVSEGDSVKQGDVIAEVVDPKIAPDIESIDAKIKAMEQQKKQAFDDYQRSEFLKKKNLISNAKFDESKTNFKVLENNLNGLKANRDSLFKHKEEGQVISGINGKVLSVPITKGSVVMTGDIIAEVAENNFVLKLGIPESYAPFIKINDEITVEDESDQEKKMRKGKVQKLYPKIETGKIIADIRLDNIDNLYVGKLMNAYIKTKIYKGFLIPENYIVKRHGMSFVILKDKGEIVIQTGKRLDGGIEILSGLQDDDILVKP